MTIEFKNYSMLIGQRYDHDWYDWCVFASSDAVSLEKVDAVEYTLHPSFPDPVRLITDRKRRFSLMSNGWGSFSIGIRVIFGNGEEEFLKHPVSLVLDWPKKTIDEFSNSEEMAIYDVLVDGSFRWRSVEKMQKRTGFDLAKIRQVLEDFASRNLARKSPIRSIDGKELWGATKIVGIEPTL